MLIISNNTNFFLNKMNLIIVFIHFNLKIKLMNKNLLIIKIFLIKNNDNRKKYFNI